MELTKETRDRIYAAADALFEQNGRDAFPTVDAVRKAARVNMNDASSGMKEWRRAQTAQAAPVAVQVPEAVSAAGGQAVAVLWQQAQELANTSSTRAVTATRPSPALAIWRSATGPSPPGRKTSLAAEFSITRVSWWPRSPTSTPDPPSRRTTSIPQDLPTGTRQ